MRIPGLLLGVSLVAAPVAAQPPLITLAPPPAPIFGPKTVLPTHIVCMDVPVSAHEPLPCTSSRPTLVIRANSPPATASWC
jgi:hypothetical protein